MRRLFATLLLLATFSAFSPFSAPALAFLFIVPDHFPAIQSAIDAAATGDSIMVRAGVYTESLSLSGKDLTIFGESGAGATILSGSTAFRILDAAGPSVTVATVLDGLTFQDGKALKGAGLRLSGGASLTARRCRFIHNRAEGNPTGAAGGAAMVGSLSRLAVDASLFQDNEAVELQFAGDGAGGAVFGDEGSELEIRSSEFIHNITSGFEGGFGGAVNVYGTALIEGCRFSEGSGWEGGGIRGSEGSDLVVRGCLFDRNQAWTGAGIYCFFATSTIEGNTFVQNHSWFGLDAAIVVADSWLGEPRTDGDGRTAGARRLSSIEHNTIAFNSSSGIGIRTDAAAVRNNIVASNDRVGLIWERGAPPPGSVACNDIWANGAGNYGGDCPDLTGIDGNISSDPRFCFPPVDFTLDHESPCTPEFSPPGCGLIGAWPANCFIEAVGPEAAPAPALRLSVRPNPVGRKAEFTFDAAIEPRVLEILDAAGRPVAVLPARGRTALTWVPSPSIAPGVYFARLAGAARSEAVKIVVLR